MEMATHSSVLAGESHGQRSLTGYSPWGCKESDMTEATYMSKKGFPCSSAGKESACNAGDPSSIPGSERSPPRRDRLPTLVFLGFPGGSVCKESACSEGDLGLIPGLGRSLGGRHGNPLQYSCLENLVDRGALWATVHGVAKDWT